MISLERAKEILNDPSLSDEEIRQIRDDFRVLAEIALEQLKIEKTQKNTITPQQQS